VAELRKKGSRRKESLNAEKKARKAKASKTDVKRRSDGSSGNARTGNRASATGVSRERRGAGKQSSATQRSGRGVGR